MSTEHGSNLGQTPFIDIPQPVREAPTYGSLQDIVGSPDQLSESLGTMSTPRPPLLPSFATARDSLPSRPEYVRSVSSVHTSPRGRMSISSTVSSIHGVTHHLFRRQPDNQRDREWTLFGDLMGNEDASLSHSSFTPRSRRGTQRSMIAPSSSTTPHSPPTPLDIMGSSRQEYSMQSPTRDTFISSRADASFTTDPGTEELGSETETANSESDDGHPPRIPSGSQAHWFSLPALPTFTPVQRNILKCCVAYFIGSLFTFSPYLSGLIADMTSYGRGDSETVPSPSGHMVATVAVYFNPAKTAGAMLEADVFCFMGLLFAAFISLSSMTMYWFFEVQPGMEWLADSLVLLFIGLGMSGVAWMKVWMAKPTFNTACSMTAIILFIVVVKEGGLETLLQVSFIVLIGSIVSNVVCYLLWPQRATRNLQDTMTKTLDSFATLLNMITQTFLLEEPVRPPNHEKIQRAVESHQASFTALKKNLIEARSERWFGGPGNLSPTRSRRSSGQAYEDAVDSLNRLGQHLNGLRSGTSLQYELIKAYKDGRLVLRNRAQNQSSASRFKEGSINGNSNGNGKGKTVEVENSISGEEEEYALLQAAADSFGELVDDVGSPLKALSMTCSSTLRRLRDALAQHTPGNGAIEPQEFSELAASLERALFTFESTSNHAILRLYRTGTGGTISAEESIASLQSLASDENGITTGSDSENVFLIYFFIFTLQEFVKELISLVDAMGRIYNIHQAEQEERRWWSPFIQPFSYLRSRWMGSDPESLQQQSERQGLRKRLSTYFATAPHRSVTFPKITPHAPNTVQTPAREELNFIGRIKRSIWALGARLREQDMKYAFKTGMATAILATPAFLDSTRPIFVEYRGEWALISFFVVMSPTIGGTNFLSLHRVLGTFMGAVTAACVWTIFPENPYALCAFGFFYSIPCFYYIVARPQYATSARFVLLTYNLTCLFCYNLRQKDVSIVDIAFHRFTAVTVGVIWAGLVSRYWWPREARRELSKALGEFSLNIGWLYTRLVAFNSMENDTGYRIHRVDEDIDEFPTTERTSLLNRSTNAFLNESIVEFMAMELHLQIKLIELQGLLAQTQHEPRLKGPFPVKLYRSILTSLQTILDKLHSMRCVTSREEWHTTVRKEFIIPVNKERREMVGNVILYFSTLAAAFRLKSPLPPYLPPAENSRQRLVEAIRKLDVIKNREIKGSRHLLFFAYALTMRGVIHELDYLGHTLQEAFGVIGGSLEEFEALFRETPEDSAV